MRSNPPFFLALHNRYMMLVLDRLTAMEASMAVREEPVVRAARLDPRLLPLSKADRALISEALARPSIVPRGIPICLYILCRLHCRWTACGNRWPWGCCRRSGASALPHKCPSPAPSADSCPAQTPSQSASPS